MRWVSVSHLYTYVQCILIFMSCNSILYNYVYHRLTITSGLLMVCVRVLLCLWYNSLCLIDFLLPPTHQQTFQQHGLRPWREQLTLLCEIQAGPKFVQSLLIMNIQFYFCHYYSIFVHFLTMWFSTPINVIQCYHTKNNNTDTERE